MNTDSPIHYGAHVLLAASRQGFTVQRPTVPGVHLLGQVAMAREVWLEVWLFGNPLAQTLMGPHMEGSGVSNP